MKKIILLLILTITLHAEVLNLSISANPSRFNPIIATDTASSAINAWIFNGLLKYDKDAQIVPEIASSYQGMERWSQKR